MRTRALLWIGLACLLRSAPADANLTCPIGAFDVDGPPIVIAGPNDVDAITIQNSGNVGAATYSLIKTTQGCPGVYARVRSKATSIVFRVKWPQCGTVLGPHRMSVTIGADCNTMTAKLKVHGVRGRRDITATRHVDTTPVDQNTFDVIQQRIFSQHGCNVSTCHGPFGQGNLDLRTGASYAQLVDVPADNAAANAAGKKRVLPGDPGDSFLSQKLHGFLTTDEGSQMPLVGGALSQLELDLVDAWIAAGAPETGVVPGAPTLPPNVYRAADPLPVPAGGYQFVLDGPWLNPGEEQEGCFWIPAPNTQDFYIDHWEYSLNPGTHHFAIYTNRIPNPPLNTWLRSDFGCFNEATFGASISGAPQAPYYVDSYPPGVARVLHAGAYVGLNAHYKNDFDVPIQIKVWTNLYPYNGTPQHIAQTLTSLDTTFGIDVPPFTQKAQRGRFQNTSGLPMSFITVSGHMHKRGLRFTAWKSNGTKLYENFDWAHPLYVLYQPPFVLQPGDWIDYECLHDNGVTRPVKRDSFGNAIDLKFGVTTDDEMCILPGSYYTD